MSKGFRVVEAVLRNDEHLVFNLTVLSELNKRKLLNSFEASDTLCNLYSTHLSFLQNIPSKGTKAEGRYLFLTGSWLILLKCLFLPGKKVIIFHNFYAFLDSKKIRNRIKILGYKILIKLGRVQATVLGAYIENSIGKKLKMNHKVLQLAYSPDIVSSFSTSFRSTDKIDKAIFGNLFPGKLDARHLQNLAPLHLGKLHGGLNYVNSIDRYLDISEYYSLLRSVDKVCILNSNNHRVASGVFADAVLLEKIAVCLKDDYINYVARKFDINLNNNGEYFEVDLSPLQEKFYDKFLKDLERL